jgi:putative SOS response-associated peptidase YedK
MCYHNSSSQPAAVLENHFGAVFQPPGIYEPVYHASGFAFPEWAVVTSENPGKIQMFTWGLIPSWMKKREEALEFRTHTLNAKSETVFEKPSFRPAVHTRRCVVSSTGFFEWREFQSRKYPYFISCPGEAVFALAGIYEVWHDHSTGEIFNTFSILTREADTFMASIHNTKKRMPVILPPALEKVWLQPGLNEKDIRDLLGADYQVVLEAHTISRRITSRHENPNVPEVQQPFVYPELPAL